MGSTEQETSIMELLNDLARQSMLMASAISKQRETIQTLANQLYKAGQVDPAPQKEEKAANPA